MWLRVWGLGFGRVECGEFIGLGDEAEGSEALEQRATLNPNTLCFQSSLQSGF